MRPAALQSDVSTSDGQAAQGQAAQGQAAQGQAAQGQAAQGQAAQGQAGGRPVDLVHLTRQCFGDKRLETELLRLFMRQARQIQGGLDAEVSDDALASLPAGDLLHTLVGSARVVGAHRVATLAETYEAALRGHDRAALSAKDRADMRAAVDEACGYIGGLLDAA